ncbi:gluconokinase [Portibacter lacus]|uniref:Gluconokinase n=1 Tax=Portibacter lacus TaxID=1099794 RepID=A0AA37WBR3_9BACT|nr:gluconokinase [Portibacter lacus]GLR15686.1 gluconokinase [Portibacter lacus]
MKKNKLIIVMGVSGSGKSTIAKGIAKSLDLPFYDADDFHPKENIAKMESGEPLNDIDRKPWLEKINAFSADIVKSTALVFACSALKESYREILSRNINVVFVYLKGSPKLIHDRMNAREDHFMPLNLLDSQFKDLEEPLHAITIDIDQSKEAIINEAISQI